MNALSILSNLLGKKRKIVSIGFCGRVNAGKTTLANRIAKDLSGKIVGEVSPIPHETRETNKVEHVKLKFDGKTLDMTLVDLPGITTKIDYRKFMEDHGLTKEESIQRAKEATRGVVEAIKMLDEIDIALMVLDCTKPPFDQIDLVIVGNLEAKQIPIIICANKIDLPEADPKLVEETFNGSHAVIPISALTGENIDFLYKNIVIAT